MTGAFGAMLRCAAIFDAGNFWVIWNSGLQRHHGTIGRLRSIVMVSVCLALLAVPRANAQIGTDLAPELSKEFSPSTIAVNETSTLTFTIVGLPLQGVTALDVEFSDTFPTGMTVAATPNVTNNCSGTFTATAGADNVSFSGGTVAADSTCTITVDVLASVTGTLLNQTTAIDWSNFGGFGQNASATLTVTDQVTTTTTPASSVIRNFIAGRASVLVSNEPQLFERLTKRFGGTTGNPLGFTASGEARALNVSFGTSLGALAHAAQRRRSEKLGESDNGLAAAGEDIRGYGSARREFDFDLWTKGKFARAENGTRRSDIGLLYLGADYRFAEGLVAGIIGQFDWTEETDRAGTSSTDGHGWMIGPYVVARLTQNLVFDARAAAGTSANQVSPTGAYTDNFRTTRFLLRAQLTGELAAAGFLINPFVRALYFEEAQHSYTDSLGNRIGRQTVSLGRVKFGPKVSKPIETDDGTVFTPHVALTGLYDFDRARQTNAQGFAVGTSRVRARVDGGLNVEIPIGVQLDAEAFYDGIGSGSSESYGGSLTVIMPLN